VFQINVDLEIKTSSQSRHMDQSFNYRTRHESTSKQRDWCYRHKKK